MKQYWSFFRLSLMRGLQYRIAAVAGMFTQFFFGLVFIMIFEAFYLHSNTQQPIELTQVIQIVWLQQAFLMFIMLWYRDREIIYSVVDGNIAYDLCRPTSLYHYWFARLIAQRLSGAMLRSIPILLVAFFLKGQYQLHPPVSFEAFLLFLLTMILGLILIVSVSMIIYISLFYTLSPVGSFLMIAVFGEFFGGMVIPIPLMPNWLQTIANILPFRYFGDLPFRIYVGHISGLEAYFNIGVQVLWIAILTIAGYGWMKHSLKRVVIQGG